MLFAESSTNVGGALLFLAIIVFGITRAAKLLKAGYAKFDKDGGVHSAAKDGVTNWIKRKFGK